MMFTDEFWSMVSDVDSVVVTSHRSPDDDSIASVLAIYRLITDRYPDKKVEMIYTGQPENGRYKSFANFEKIRFVEELADCLEGVGMLVMVDGSQWNRFGNNPEKLKQYQGKTVCIDHHSTEADKFDLIQIDKDSPACAGLIYQLFSAEGEIDQELARIYLLGILGDSGDFAYLRPDQMGMMDIGRKLLTQIGLSVQDFSAQYATISPRIFDLIRELMKNTEYCPQSGSWPARQVASLDRKYVDEGGYTMVEISQAANLYMGHYLRWVTGYPWGVVITPRDGGKYHMSLRSLTGSVNVRRVVERMGIGGGHDRAAAGTFVPPVGELFDLAKVAAKFDEWLIGNVREEAG